MTNDDIEELLGRLTPRGVRPDLRPQVLAALASQLEVESALPWLRRSALAVAASILVGIAMNIWASHLAECRLAQLFGPPTVSKQAMELANAVEKTTDAQTAHWVHQRCVAAYPSGDGLAAFVAYSDVLRRLIDESSIFKEPDNEALKKTLKWTGVILGGLVAIGLVANAVLVWTTDTRLERQLAAIRAAGDPLTLTELARNPIPPKENAATYLHRAEADLRAIQGELSNVHSIWVLPLPQMTSEDRSTIHAAFHAYPGAIPLLEQAADCPDYDAQLDYTLSAHEFNMQLIDVAQKFRSAILLLNARGLLLVNEGDRDEAVRTGLVIFRLARHFDRNPTLVAFFPALATREMAIQPVNLALQTGAISKRTRDALDAELAVQEHMGSYPWVIKSDRAFELDMVRNVPYRNFWLIRRAIWNRRQSALLDESQAMLALPYNPIYKEASRSLHRVQVETSAVLGEDTSKLGMPFQATLQAVTRVRAQLSCLRVLNALQNRPSPDSDKAPNLNDLGLPPETTTDPFTGMLLHVKKTRQGWLVYSVGANLQDDGGKIDYPENSDVGVGPAPSAAIVPNRSGEKVTK